MHAKSNPAYTSHSPLGRKARAKARREGKSLAEVARSLKIEPANLFHVLSGRVKGSYLVALKRWLKS